MVKDQTMAIKVDDYIDKRLEEKLGNVRTYVDLKIAELNGQYKRLEGKFGELRGELGGRMNALEGQMQGLRDSYKGLDMKVDTVLIKLQMQYETVNYQYEQVMELLKVLLERTDPEKIGFTRKK